MKIAITGTRGIPNNYGGFEQFTENLSIGLAKKGHQVVVYNPHYHSYRRKEFEGVKILRTWLPENLFGAAANYIYDLRSIRNALKGKVDIILQCGYASASFFYPLINFRKTRLITHMDGMEWRRPKWNKVTREIIGLSEKIAARYSHHIVCDHINIARYYRLKYSRSPEVIPYGAWSEKEYDGNIPCGFGLAPGHYLLLIARFEPENNIRMIIKGWEEAETDLPLVIVGNYNSGFGRKIYREYFQKDNIVFLGGVYNQSLLNNLRHSAKAIFHGHSAGGTNPSLLEAMAAGVPVLAHKNQFNCSILGDNAIYYRSSSDIKGILPELDKLMETAEQMVNNNLQKVKMHYCWDSVVDQYEDLFIRTLKG